MLKKDTSDETADGVTVKDRLRAWWNGDDLAAGPDPPGGNGRKSDRGGSDAADAYRSGASVVADRPWSETRRQLAQEIWGHGFVVLGGTEYVEKLVSGCSLTAAETLLEIGIGMGGGTRIIIGKFSNYVTAYERDSILTAAMCHAVKYDVDDKLVVTTLPFEDHDLKPKNFRAAPVREIL